MKMKSVVLMGLGLMTAMSSYAADPLNGTVWKTIDDETKQAKALVMFKEQANGTLSATIQRTYMPKDDSPCLQCEGPYKGKSLKGVTIAYGLTNMGKSHYEQGNVVDPKTGKTYRLKADLVSNGQVLNLRGYLGISLLGRNQTWVRVQ